MNERIKPADIKPDSIEKIVCEKMSSLTQQPLDDDTTEILILFKRDPDSAAHAKEIIKKVWTAQALVNRMGTQFGTVLDARIAIIVAGVAESIGGCVMYAYYMQMMAKRRGVKKLDLDDIGWLFPIGFYAKDDMHGIWESQKVDNGRDMFDGLEFRGGSDNLVDYGYAAQSLEHV